MKITDPAMQKKMDKALKLDGGLFTLDDIEDHLRSGKIQGHVEGDTWVLTQIHDWPQRRAVNIMYLVGSMENALKLEPKLECWAKANGANLLTAMGRESWVEFKTPGWKKIGSLFSKDI
jgi:hypothetical protein